MSRPVVHGEKSALIAGFLPPRRRKAGLVYTEGERVVPMALEGAWRPKVLFLEEAYSESSEGAALARLAARRICRVELASEKALSRLSDCETPPPAGLIIEPAIPRLSDLAALPGRLLVVDRLKDPGNVGTLVRSALAFGFSTVFTRGTVSPTNEKLLRSSAGTCFLEGAVIDGGEASAMAETLLANDLLVYTLEPALGRELHTLRVPDRPIALVLGSEVAGVDGGTWKGAQAVRIPMTPGVESLNVAMAGTIALYEFSRMLSS